MPYVRHGRLQAIAVADAQRSPLAPDLPTLAESGIPGVELPHRLAADAQAGTPEAVLYAKAQNLPKFHGIGTDTPTRRPLPLRCRSGRTQATASAKHPTRWR